MARRSSQPRRRRRRNQQVGLFAEAAPGMPAPRTDVWQLGDGGIAPHSYTPDIPELDYAKLPKEFQGNKLRKMSNGDWIMWPLDAKTPTVEGKGKKAKWKYPDPKRPKQTRTAIGGGSVGREGKKKWSRGGLTDDQLQAIQFAAELKGSPKQRALALVKQNALYVISHSAGKDSQAMYLYVHRELEIPAEQTVTMHADLPGADWPSIALPSGKRTPTLVDHMQATMFGMPLRIVVARWGTTERTPEKHRGQIKTFHDYVRHRHTMRPDDPSFPSVKNRWCTGDLKTAPLQKAIREELCVRNNLREPFQKDSSTCKVDGQPWRVVVDCEGLRGGESADRAARDPWHLDVELCKWGKIWFTWLPIFDWTAKTDKKYKPKKTDVVEYILSKGQTPFWTYGTTPEHMAMIQERAPGAEHGVTRLSCQFCIYSSPADQQITAQLDPEAYAVMCALEKDVGSSLSLDRAPLQERVGIIPVSSLTKKRVANPDALVNPWRELGVTPPDPRIEEEFTVHDLQLAEILAKGPYPERRSAKRRLMGGGGSRSSRRPGGRKLNRGHVPTRYAGVVLVPRSSSSAIEAYDVLVEGNRQGTVELVRVGKDRRWAAQTKVEREGTDHVSVEFVDSQDAALDAVLEEAKVRKQRRQGRARAQRNATLTAPLGDALDLDVLKRKLMR